MFLFCSNLKCILNVLTTQRSWAVTIRLLKVKGFWPHYCFKRRTVEAVFLFIIMFPHARGGHVLLEIFWDFKKNNKQQHNFSSIFSKCEIRRLSVIPAEVTDVERAPFCGIYLRLPCESPRSVQGHPDSGDEFGRQRCPCLGQHAILIFQYAPKMAPPVCFAVCPPVLTVTWSLSFRNTREIRSRSQKSRIRPARSSGKSRGVRRQPPESARDRDRQDGHTSASARPDPFTRPPPAPRVPGKLLVPLQTQDLVGGRSPASRAVSNNSSDS